MSGKFSFTFFTSSTGISIKSPPASLDSRSIPFFIVTDCPKLMGLMKLIFSLNVEVYHEVERGARNGVEYH